MTWELVAVDTAGGRAVLRKAVRWFLASKARAWQPEDVDSQRAQFLAASMTRVRKSCRTFEEAVLEAGRICAGGQPGPPAPEAWEARFPDVIRAYGGVLDGLLKARGCSTDESQHLSLEVFRRLFDQGPLDDDKISWRLYRLALDICPSAGKPSGTVPPSDRGAAPSRLEGARLVKALRALEPRTFRCLYFWAVEKSGREDTARFTRLSEDQVLSRLVEVADRLGRSIDQLGDPDVVEACLRVAIGPRP